MTWSKQVWPVNSEQRFNLLTANRGLTCFYQVSLLFDLLVTPWLFFFYFFPLSKSMNYILLHDSRHDSSHDSRRNDSSPKYPSNNILFVIIILLNTIDKHIYIYIYITNYRQMSKYYKCLIYTNVRYTTNNTLMLILLLHPV